MIEMSQLMGRLGSQMFYFAFMRCWCKENGWNHEWIPGGVELFIKHEKLIRQMYGSGIPATRQGVVSVHVRRGDYLEPGRPFVDLWKTDYYQKAMALFRDKTFAVFSDDIEWCKKQILFTSKGARCTFVEFDGPPEKHMNLMASCEHNIIANSCFSWWAAWLNPNPDKIVVAPRLWTYDHYTSAPPDWELL